MFAATVIVSSLLALTLIASAGAKLARIPRIMTVMAAVGFPENRLWLLAAVETAGGAGLVLGLFWWPIGVAAAVGVILYFIAALGAHLRVKDKNVAGALVLLVVAMATLVLQARAW